MGRSRVALLVIVFMVSVLALSACSPKTPTTTWPWQWAENQVIISGGFVPPTITVSAGATVTWVNQENEDHTVTSNDGLFSSILTFDASYSYTFNNRGTFSYRCNFHTQMTGRVIVE